MRLRMLVCVVLSVSLLLVSCTRARTPYTVEDARTLLNSGAFDGELIEVTGPAIPLLYGIEADELIDSASFRAANTAVSADEVTVLILASEDAAERAEKSCLEHIESELENARSYTPAAVPALEAAIVDRVGATVLVAVGNPDTLPDAVNDLKE